MQITDEVQKALQTLRNAAENDFERHRIDVLERDLTAPPVVEVIDDKHQRFLGISFRKRKEGHYFNPCLSIYRLVWLYHYGELPPRTVIHHIDHNKDNNNIDNLTPMLLEEHRRHHAKGGFGGHKAGFVVCKICGVEFLAKNNNALYCPSCREEVKRKRATSKPKEIKPKPAKPPRTKKCVICGKEFELRKKEGSTKNRQTCSIECGEILRKRIAQSKTVNRSRICIVCGKQFEYKKKCQKTCSSECAHVLTAQAVKARPARLLKRVISHCELCGKEIEHLSSKQPRFCSRDCLNKWLSVSRVKEIHANEEIRTCACCGKPFKVTRSAKKQWCSPECHKKLNKKVCPFCGKEFIPTKPDQICCSMSCAKKKYYAEKK